MYLFCFWPIGELGTRDSSPQISSASRLEAVVVLVERLMAAFDPLRNNIFADDETWYGEASIPILGLMRGAISVKFWFYLVSMVAFKQKGHISPMLRFIG